MTFPKEDGCSAHVPHLRAYRSPPPRGGSQPPSPQSAHTPVIGDLAD